MLENSANVCKACPVDINVSSDLDILFIQDVRELDEHAVSTIDGSIYIQPDGSDIAEVMEKIFNRLQGKAGFLLSNSI